MKRTSLAILSLCALVLSPVAMTRPATAQTVSCSGVAAWSANSVSYAVGALVTYNGSEYKCIQAHTSEAGWDPVDVPALWSLVGTCSTSTTSTTTGATCSAAPGVPTGLSASSTTQTGTTLSWNAVTPPSNCTITSYTIYKSGTSIGTSTSTSFAVTGLSAGTGYSFTVAATDSDGTGSQSSTVGVTTSSASCSAVPSAPGGLAASGTSSSGTTLGWNAVTPPSNCSISSYTIYKSGTSIGTSTSTSFAVTGLSASTAYSFTVAATDSDGTGSQSSSISVTTSSSGGTSCWPAWVSTTAYNGGAQVSYNNENYQAAYWTQNNNPSTNSGAGGSGEPWIPEGSCSGGASCSSAPSAPTGLSASGTSQTGTTLSWSAVTAPANCSITGYTVYQNGSSIGTTTSTSLAVSGLTAGTSYSFTVAASDSDGAGSQSSSISVTTSANTCTTKPSAPGGLSASGTTSGSTNLSWNSVSAPSGCSISGYTVYENGSAIATVSSGTSYTVTGLAASTSYTFTVAAVDSDGTGSQSSSISVTTTAGSSSGPITNDVIGYWDNWGTFTMPNTSMNYQVLNYAFAVGSGTDGATLVMWTPSSTNPLSNAAADIASTKAQGRTVLLSLGGATSPNITLLNSTDVSNFVSSVEGLVSQYGFQGIDLDFENSSVTVNSGDSLSNPTTPDIVFLAQALSQIKSHFGSSFIITYVPETADIDAYSAVGGEWGGYLYLINATRSILTYVDTQCYDSGSMDAANGQVVSEGGADFMVAMSELLLHGYTISGGQNFAGLSPSQVAFGNLYNGTAASSSVAAYNYLTKGTPDGGSYTLIGGPYPNMAGSMVWDINGDESTGYAYSNTLVAGGLK